MKKIIIGLAVLAIAMVGLAIPASAREDSSVKSLGLTSMCKPSSTLGSLRVTATGEENVSVSVPFTLTLYGTSTAFTGTTPALVTVPWTDGSNTWVLRAGNKQKITAIGNNPLCPTPPVPVVPTVPTGPGPYVQAYGLVTDPSCQLTVDWAKWSGVPDGGWHQSWHMWMNGGTGGFVCQRVVELVNGSWTIAP